MMRPILAVALLGAMPFAANAQRVVIDVDGRLSLLSTTTTDSTGVDKAEGLLAGIEARLGLGRVGLIASYAEGQVGAQQPRTFAEGSAALSVGLGPAFELRVGPVARALVTDSTGARWIQWRAMGRYLTEIAPGRTYAYAEGWFATGTRSGVEGIRAGGSGAAVGVGWTRGQLGARLEYSVDEARLGARERLTVERLTVLVELVGRR